MSKPKYPEYDEGQPIRGNYTLEECAHYALLENISGQSALNMYPEPNGKDGFISVSDNMVAHAMEHFHASAHWTMILVNTMAILPRRPL